MALSALLRVLGWKLRASCLFDASFRKRIAHVERVVAIRTRDGRAARSYSFLRGRVRATRGVHPDASVELVWDDARTALSAMLSRNPLDTFSAIGRGDLTIRGNLQDALWFNDVAA